MTPDAFIAAVSEAGHPPTFVRQKPATAHFPKGVAIVRWDAPHELPDAVGMRAREITGLTSAWPVSVHIHDGQVSHWLECWLFEKFEP